MAILVDEGSGMQTVWGQVSGSGTAMSDKILMLVALRHPGGWGEGLPRC
jgi:hypothetical protein